MVLLMIASALAGCTSGDPDGDGEMGIDTDVLNQMIEDNLQDFINNSSVTVHQTIHYHNNTTYVVDDGDYSSSNTVHHHYNNTTINEGDETNTNNYNNQTDYDYSELNYSFGGVAGGNGSGGMLYLLDIQFTLEDLMPDWAEVDHRNNTIDYEYTYYDYLTNSDRTDVFTIQCSDYYLIGSQSENSSFVVSYWQSSSNYWDAWVDQYNQTIANMLQNAAYDYYQDNTTGVSDYHVRIACDENYNPGGGFDDLLLFEIDIPAGVALAGVYDGYFRGIEEYVWDYENIYRQDWNDDLGQYEWLRTGPMMWKEDYYPELAYSYSRSSFGVDFEFETISWNYQYGGWVGGDDQSVLNVYVDNIYPGYEYRLIAYFTMSPVLPLE